jgi:hypothetical protein
MVGISQKSGSFPLQGTLMQQPAPGRKTWLGTLPTCPGELSAGPRVYTGLKEKEPAIDPSGQYNTSPITEDRHFWLRRKNNKIYQPLGLNSKAYSKGDLNVCGLNGYFGRVQVRVCPVVRVL